MSELENANRTVGVHVKNATWLTDEQIKNRFTWMQRELDSSLVAISLQLDNLLDKVEVQSAKFTQAGEHLDLCPGKFGYINLAIDGDGEEFEANVVVLYQAREDGEFIPVKLLGNDGVAVTETSSKSSIYKVLAPQGQTIRAIASNYVSGNIFVTLTALNTGSY